MKGMQIGWSGLSWFQALHTFIGMAESFKEPERIGRFQATSAQDCAHFLNAAAAGIGEDGQCFWALLKCAAEAERIPPMQADPVRVLPRTPQPGEGQLQRTWPGVKAQSFSSEAFAEVAANAKPERISAGEDDGRGVSIERGECVTEHCRVVTGNALLCFSAGFPGV